MTVETKYVLVYKNRPVNEEGVPVANGTHTFFNSKEEIYALLAQMTGPTGLYRIDTHLICTNPE